MVAAIYRFYWPFAPSLGAVLGLGFALAGCERDTSGLGLAPVDDEPGVFVDELVGGVIFQPFLDTKIDALALDSEQRFHGKTSLRVTIPGPGDDTGLYTGGAFTTAYPRDYSSYNALTFWAKASRAATLDVAGIGNDNTGTSQFIASRGGIPLTTSWTKIVVPIPLASKLGEERGAFFFAEGAEQDQGFTVWFDEIQYEFTSSVTNPRATLLPATRAAFVGQLLTMQNTRTTFNVDGVDLTIQHMPSYFTFASSDETIAKVIDGKVLIVGTGTADITAKLGETIAGGRVTLNASAPPDMAPPVPIHPAADVISLFSDSYENRPVGTWSTDWDSADYSDLEIQSNAVKAYSALGFAGIEFAAPTIDASSMTHFHIDAWVPDGFFIKVKLVDFGGDAAPGGGDDSESAEIGKLIDPGQWVSFDLPLTEFTGVRSTAHLAQLILLGNPSVLFVDNIYFHK